MKAPKLSQVTRFLKLPQKKRLNAATALRRGAQVEEFDEEPQTNLAGAFIVVLVLHAVAVVGIWMFNSINGKRGASEAEAAASAKGAKPAATASAKAVPPAASSSKPASSEAHPVAGAPVAGSAPVAPVVAPISGARLHHVKTGDSLAKVAAQYGVSVEEIEEANGAKNVAILRPGQTLNIPRSRSAAVKKEEASKVAAAKKEEAPKVTAISKTAPVAGSGGKTYTVAKGDNPVAIARRLGVNYNEMLKLNGIDDPKKLRPGQVLKIPAK